ncbi:MAG: uroporphyrinogen decarboxylase [Actinobacteria bacterium]|nr:uroporphyrinogen decarboxylase [Actinomycetota bacterium]
MSKQFTSRQRVIETLNHREPDRVPRDLGGRVSTMMKGAYRAFKDYLKLDDCGYDTINPDWYTVDEFDERVLEFLGIDFRRLFLKSSSNYSKIIEDDGSWKDELGFTRRYTGMYGEILDHPLRHISDESDIDKYKFYNAYDQARVEGLKEKAEHLYNSTNYAIVAAGAIGGLLETCTWMRGFDQFPIDLVFNKKLAHALLEKLTNYYTELMDIFLSSVGPYIQMVEMADDIGYQNNLLISPELYRGMILPYYRRLLDFVKSKTKAKIFHHSCGAVTKGAEILIDAGVDILNSLQPRATGMDTTYLKDKFGDRLSFHGGVDIQWIMPSGTTTDVENEVKRRIAIYAPGGGYILCAAHDIQEDVPPENVVALYMAGEYWGSYPLGNEIFKLRRDIQPY